MNIKKIDKYLDKALPLSERKKDFNDRIDKMMNPFPKETFDPTNFEPMPPEDDLEPEIYTRERKKHSGKFPTFGIEPKKIREGQLIGMFESKQDLYLLFAHKVNDLIDEMNEMRQEIKKLKKE
jgi:hypothetical protein